jgi:hypothetical protein
MENYLLKNYQKQVIEHSDIDVETKKIRPLNSANVSSPNTVYEFRLPEGRIKSDDVFLDIGFICQDSTASANIATYAAGTATTHTFLRPDFFSSMFSQVSFECDDYHEDYNTKLTWVPSMIFDGLTQKANSNKDYPYDFTNGITKITSETLSTSNATLVALNALVAGGTTHYLRLKLPMGMMFSGSNSFIDLPKNSRISLTLNSSANMFWTGASVVISPVISSFSRMDLILQYIKPSITSQAIFAPVENAVQYIRCPKFQIQSQTVANAAEQSTFKVTSRYAPHSVFLVYKRTLANGSGRTFNHGNVRRARLMVNGERTSDDLETVSNSDKIAVYEEFKKALNDKLDDRLITFSDFTSSIASNDNFTVYSFPVNSVLGAQESDRTYELEVQVDYKSTAAIASTAYVVICHTALIEIDNLQNRVSRIY